MEAKLVIIDIDLNSELLKRPELFCSDGRLKKCAAIKNDAVRMQGYAAELALSYALSGARFEKPEYRYLKNGKPVVDGGFVSLSHSGKFAACVYADRPVGVDIEAPRFVDPKIAKKVLSERELKELFSAEDENYLLRKFVMKEAFLKMTGEGITGGLSGIEERDGIVFRNGFPAGYCLEFGGKELIGFAVSEEKFLLNIERPEIVPN